MARSVSSAQKEQQQQRQAQNQARQLAALNVELAELKSELRVAMVQRDESVAHTNQALAAKECVP